MAAIQQKHEAKSTVPITWEKFKTFLYQSLGDSRAFVDSYWAKIKRDSQYQQEHVLDWAAYLEHLQAVFQEFDSVAAPNKDTMIWYFRKDLRPSIRAQLDVRDRDLDSWDEVADKIVDAKAKASLQALSETKEMDSRCPWDQQPTKKDDKDSKDYKKNKSSQNLLANVSLSGTQSSPAQPKKDQNSRSHRERLQQQSQGQNTPATSINATAVRKDKDKDKDKKNFSNIECYTCKQKGHYTNKYLKKKLKTSVGLGDLHVGNWR